jgi:hypothetical protein
VASRVNPDIAGRLSFGEYANEPLIGLRVVGRGAPSDGMPSRTLARREGIAMNIKEITGALDAKMINQSGEIKTEFGNFIIQMAKSLSSEIENYILDNKTDFGELHPLGHFSKKLLLISWCYPISTKKVEASRVNRLHSMFCGPFFTSNEFPWPEIDGRYAEPIVQLNLEEIQSISSVQIGSGMLQLWGGEWGEDDFLFRIIPRPELKKKNMSAIPECIEGEYYGDVRWGSGLVAWPENHYKKNVPISYQISDFKLQKLNWPGGLDDMVSCLEADLKDTQLAGRIVEFVSIFPCNRPSTEPHLFGSFDPIQYDPIDANATFLALEGRPCFDWNSGNAQISYWQNDKGKVEFGFAWSCQ